MKFWMIVFLVLILLKSPIVKGMIGEMIVAIFLRFLNKDIYSVYHDLYIPKDDGTTTQIDHIITSPYGIFVVETKNYKGWIFGSEKAKNWTQVIYKTKNKFYNPILQNKGHIRHLKSYLNYSNEDAFISIISFSLRATLKKIETTTKVLYSPFLVQHIKKFQEVLIEAEDLMKVNEEISSLGIASFKTRRDHVKYIKGSKKPEIKNVVPNFVETIVNEEDEAINTIMKCPMCHSELVPRKGKRGAFMGCSGYPKCKYTSKIGGI